MKTLRFVLTVAALAGSAPGFAAEDPPRASSAATEGKPADVRAIHASIDAFCEAFKKADAKAIAAMFTEDGEAIDAFGAAIQGRPALEAHYAGRFAANPGDSLSTKVDSVSFIAPGVARAVGRTQVNLSDGAPPLTGRFSAIHVNRNGQWLAASVRELVEDLTHHDHLKQLEWLIGDWMEESDEAVVLNSFAWTEDKNYLIRSFDVRIKGKPALKGTQRIGWDPLTQQIKSWVFDSQGGYGDGLWTRHGEQWVIKATGVRPDGHTTSATQVLTFVSKDSLRWKSIDRTLGGEINGDIDEIVMVRRPPQPK